MPGIAVTGNRGGPFAITFTNGLTPVDIVSDDTSVATIATTGVASSPTALAVQNHLRSILLLSGNEVQTLTLNSVVSNAATTRPCDFEYHCDYREPHRWHGGHRTGHPSPSGRSAPRYHYRDYDGELRDHFLVNANASASGVPYTFGGGNTRLTFGVGQASSDLNVVIGSVEPLPCK